MAKRRRNAVAGRNAMADRIVKRHHISEVFRDSVMRAARAVEMFNERGDRILGDLAIAIACMKHCGVDTDKFLAAADVAVAELIKHGKIDDDLTDKEETAATPGRPTS